MACCVPGDKNQRYHRRKIAAAATNATQDESNFQISVRHCQMPFTVTKCFDRRGYRCSFLDRNTNRNISQLPAFNTRYPACCCAFHPQSWQTTDDYGMFPLSPHLRPQIGPAFALLARFTNWRKLPFVYYSTRRCCGRHAGDLMRAETTMSGTR